MAGVWFPLDMYIFYLILSFSAYPFLQLFILILHSWLPYIHNRIQKLSLKPFIYNKNKKSANNKEYE